MKGGFIVDNGGQPIFSWAWHTSDICPFRNSCKLQEGDIMYICDDFDIDAFAIFSGDLKIDKMIDFAIDNNVDVWREQIQEGVVKE